MEYHGTESVQQSLQVISGKSAVIKSDSFSFRPLESLSSFENIRINQGCLSPKEFTHIKNGNDACCIFEGFMDYLFYLTLKTKHHPEQPNIEKKRDYIVLNSLTNLSKAIDIISGYNEKYCFLDNDESGKKALLTISNRCGFKLSDQSVFYCDYKDLNDYLCKKKLLPVKQIRKGFRL